MTLSLTLQSLDDTAKLATTLANNISGGAVILLEGELGAGKTAFTKYFARALGVEEEVTSPTFVLEAEYNFSRNGHSGIFCHWDLYRLKADSPELHLDILEKSRNGAVVCIEWPEKIVELKVVNDLLIRFSHASDENARVCEISGSESLVEAIQMVF